MMPDTPDASFTEDQISILVELQALQHTASELSKRLDEVIRQTSPDSALVRNQQLALDSLAGWRTLFQATAPLACPTDVEGNLVVTPQDVDTVGSRVAGGEP